MEPFEDCSFAIIVPRQNEEGYKAIAEYLDTLCAKEVYFEDSTLVDKDGNSVYDITGVIVLQMPILTASYVLNKWDKKLIENQTYKVGDIEIPMYC